MKIKGIKQSSIYYGALIFLYDEATKGMNGEPSDNIEFAFETLEKLVDLYDDYPKVFDDMLKSHDKVRQDLDNARKVWVGIISNSKEKTHE